MNEKAEVNAGGDKAEISGEHFTTRPGDDFIARGDIRPILLKHGWTSLGVQQDGNEYWRRPGKTEDGHSATLKDGVFYVFSSNAAPFEPDRPYNIFSAYTMLEHNGDFDKAASELLKQGYGKGSADNSGVDLSALLGEQSINKEASHMRNTPFRRENGGFSPVYVQRDMAL